MRSRYANFTYTVPSRISGRRSCEARLRWEPPHCITRVFSRVSKLTTRVAPSPENGIDDDSASPFYLATELIGHDPALNPTQPISVSWRTTVLGSRINEQENNTQRVVGALEGTVAGWDYQAAALWSKSEIDNEFISGYPGTTALRNGVTGIGGAPFLNPFGDQTPAGLAYLQASTVPGVVQEGESELRGLSGVISRQFGQLPGGPITAAIGAEFRDEEMVYRTDVPKASQAASAGLAGAGALREGDRDIRAIALEMSFPMARVWKSMPRSAMTITAISAPRPIRKCRSATRQLNSCCFEDLSIQALRHLH